MMHEVIVCKLSYVYNIYIHILKYIYICKPSIVILSSCSLSLHFVHATWETVIVSPSLTVHDQWPPWRIIMSTSSRECSSCEVFCCETQYRSLYGRFSCSYQETMCDYTRRIMHSTTGKWMSMAKCRQYQGSPRSCQHRNFYKATNHLLVSVFVPCYGRLPQPPAVELAHQWTKSAFAASTIKLSFKRT